MTIAREVLNAVDWALVGFNTSTEPVFVNNKAASLLEIRQREDLTGCATVLAPFVPLINAAANTIRFRPVVRELSVQTTTGRIVETLSFVQSVNFGTDAGGISSLVGFYDLSGLKPLIEMVEQAKRTRQFVVLCASLSGVDPAFVKQSDLLAAYREAESRLFQPGQRSYEDLMHTDLLAGLTQAVDIVNPLVPPSVKIVVDARTSALLQISKPNFLRLISHLLLEASDFAGPFGLVRVKVVLRPAREGRKASATAAIAAQRRLQEPLESSPLELYLYRRLMPTAYKVGLREELDDSGSHPALKEESALKERLALVSEELSGNLAIAKNLAAACSCELEMRHAPSRMLALSARFPLLEERAF